jgi:hypothetical protein
MAKQKVTGTGDWFEQSVMESIREGWLVGDCKRCTAVPLVVNAMGWDVYNTLPIVTIYTPSFNHYRCVQRTTPTGVLMYLSPMLELESQAKVNFTVAHEFAHIALGHHLPDNQQMTEQAERHEDRPAERAADALAMSWGFKRKRSQMLRVLKAASRVGK